MLKGSFAGIVLTATLTAGALTFAPLSAGGAQQAPIEERQSLADMLAVVAGVSSCRYNGNDAPESQRFFCGKLVVEFENRRPLKWQGFSMRPSAGVGIAQGGNKKSPSPGLTVSVRTTNVVVPVMLRTTRESWKRFFVTTGAQADVEVSCIERYKSGSFSGKNDCVDQGKFDMSIFAGGGAALEAMGREFILELYIRQGFFQKFKQLEIHSQSIEVQVKVPLRRGRQPRSGAV
jgi:hypothetical protein